MWEVNANATSVKGMLNGTDHLGLRLIVFMQEAGGFGFLDCYKFNVSPGGELTWTFLYLSSQVYVWQILW
nr:hypothetical protein CFP56_49281 [Quercus suber]